MSKIRALNRLQCFVRQKNSVQFFMNDRLISSSLLLVVYSAKERPPGLVAVRHNRHFLSLGMDDALNQSSKHSFNHGCDGYIKVESSED